MGQNLDVLKSCDGSCNQAGSHAVVGRRKGSSGGGGSSMGCADWEEEVALGCHALEDGLKSAVANANRGGTRVSDAVLLNHELLQYARQGNVKGVSTALERGAWTETRRPLVMKPQKPENQGGGPDGKGASKGKQTEQPDIGMTALMFSAQAGSSECVRRLLWSGAEVNAIEEDGWSALHFAAKEGHLEVCAALLHGKANPNLVNQDDKTPLQVALDEEDGGSFAERLRGILAGKGLLQGDDERRCGDQREVREDDQ